MQFATIIALTALAVGVTLASSTEESIKDLSKDIVQCGIDAGVKFAACMLLPLETKGVFPIPKVLKCAILTVAKFALCVLEGNKTAALDSEETERINEEAKKVEFLKGFMKIQELN